MVPIRGEGHIQDTPAYIPGLDALEFMKAAIPAVIQSDCLVCVSGDPAELGNNLLKSSYQISISISEKGALTKHP